MFIKSKSEIYRVLNKFTKLINNIIPDVVIEALALQRENDYYIKKYIRQYKLSKNELSDYTESFRLPNDAYSIEIHHEGKFVVLADADNEAVLSIKFDDESTFVGAIYNLMREYIQIQNEIASENYGERSPDETAHYRGY